MEKKLPKGWVETELQYLAAIQSGGTPSRAIKSYWDGNIPWLKISDFKELYIDKAEEFITEDGLKNSSTRIFPKGTILFTIFASIGKIGILKFDAAANQAISGITPIDKISNKYLLYSLKELSESLKNEGKGVAQKNINQQILKETKIPLPPLAEQERIVAKLDTLFAQQELMKKALERIPTLLKNFRQQVLTQAVTGKLINLNKLDKKIISDFFDVRTGATPKKGTAKYYNNSSIPWIKSGEVRNSFIYEVSEFITDLAVKETNAKVFPIDTILIAMYGEGKTRGQVGWMKIEAATNQAIAALVNNDLNLSTRKYIYFYCLSQYNEIRAKAEGGNQPNLNLTKIKNWEISIPKEEFKQQEIVRRVESLFAQADAIEARYQKLKEKIEILPQAILHKAFKGELVAQLPTDGDARDLLEEIKALKASSLKVKKMYKPIDDVISMVAED